MVFTKQLRFLRLFHPPAQPEIKKGGLNFLIMIIAYANRRFSFRQIVTYYKDLALTGWSPAVVHAVDT